MSCADDLAATNSLIQQYRAGLLAYLTQASNLRAANEALRAQLAGRNAASSTATGAATRPTTRPTTQPQEERRGGDGEMAQYAALLRDIADMEGRLDKLEVR